MTDFLKYPTDFVSITSPFSESELENLLKQDAKNLSFIIDLLKRREVNAVKALEKLKLKIEGEISAQKKELEFATNAHSSASVIEQKINLLENLL